MSSQVYKKIEVIGASETGLEGAIQNAVGTAHESLRNLRWFEVKDIRGSIDGDRVKEWQVDLTLAFSLESGKKPKIGLGEETELKDVSPSPSTPPKSVPVGE